MTRQEPLNNQGLPSPQGLYNPINEHDNCGIGLVANIKGVKSHDIIVNGLKILENLTHRGAVGADPLSGDGAGILIQMPDDFMQAVAQQENIALPSLGEYGVLMMFLPLERNLPTRLKKPLKIWSVRKARNSSAGGTCPPTTVASAKVSKPPSPPLCKDLWPRATSVVPIHNLN